MIYINGVEIFDTYVKGSIKDLKEYFRYEIASQSMSVDFDFENYSNNVHNIIDLLDNLYEDTMNETFSDNDIIVVTEHPMGNFVIERDEI